jgi:transcriptional regulator with XRE-family HTH domain
MEFHEKLQELRKQRGLTQEELAEALYVSRTAISKWESGRGYPNIDSLKEISNFFSVSIDDLLSSEKMLFIAEKEHKTNLQSMFDLLLGIVDICSFLLIVLPLYPKTTGEYIYSVNLIEYTQNNVIIRMIFWLLFVAVIAVGVIKNLLVQLKVAKGQKALTFLSMGLSIFIVVFLALTREVYAVVVAFLLLVIKGLLLVRYREIM